MYSVVPALRGKADEVEVDEPKSKGFISSIRRISLGSRSSGSSDKGSNKGKGKKKAADTQEAWSEPPFPKLSSPFVAEYHKEIIVTASNDEPGQVGHLELDKRITIEGLGVLEVHAHSDMVRARRAGLTGVHHRICIFQLRSIPQPQSNGYDTLLSRFFGTADDQRRSGGSLGRPIQAFRTG